MNRIIHGDCTEVLKTLSAESVDFVLTDPPYGVCYRDRSGRTIANDSRPETTLAAFGDLHRVLKPDSFCISFYGWNHADAFLAACKNAGFTPVGHIVWSKRYASSTRYLRACHEQAYVLARGRPQKPARPIADVRPWEYTGNRFHPTEKAVSILQPLIETFSAPGALVLDPFAGSGSTCVAAALKGRRTLGIEIEAAYCDHARSRLQGAERYVRARSSS